MSRWRGRQALAPCPSFEPDEQVRRLVIILRIGPISITFRTIIAVGILAPPVCFGAREHNPNCHAVVVHQSTALRVVGCIRVRAAMLLQWHYSVLVLVANLWTKRKATEGNLNPSTPKSANIQMIKSGFQLFEKVRSKVITVTNHYRRKTTK